MCLYCSRPISTDDRIALCDRCYAAHHEECWERNGRCSTFRCTGVPRTMRGEDLAVTLQAALERANEQPQNCPYCGSKAYAGSLQGQRPSQFHDLPSGPGLLFLSQQQAGKGWLGRLIRGKKSWFLPGAQIRARSCGRCRRLFIWGVPIDEAFVQKIQTEEAEHFCPHCSTVLLPGEIVLNKNTPGHGRFECEDAPDFHRDWLGHNILDRYFLNKWHPPILSLPAYSCPECQYTEVAGRPIYRFV
jgi:hypothetical protein